jgi:chromate transport protein ChrA
LINPLLAAVVHAVVGTAVVSTVFSVFRTHYKLQDVALACVGAAAVTLVPVVGGPLSLIALAGLLYWRTGAAWVDIAIGVAMARLAMVPALMPFA